MSSVTSLYGGGAGSEGASGMGSGTERIVYKRSGSEESSIGKIVESVVRSVVRKGVNRVRREERRSLRLGFVGTILKGALENLPFL